MAPNASNLSNPKYGYDFVVATTQESINAGLVQYLQKSKQPISYLCFLADQNGTPSVQITLDDLLKKTDNTNPFDIPAGTDWSDPRIQKLFRARFVCGIRMQMGIPPGLIKNIPNKGPQLVLPEPMVVLDGGVSSVAFNMYCAKLDVIQSNPPSGWGGIGSWNWFSQQSGTPWYVKTKTDLRVESLNNELNTTYFNNNPEEKAALRAKLNNLSSSAFSLQQLLFNLDSSIAQTTPKFVGVSDATATFLLGSAFIGLWVNNAKTNGAPLLAVNAVAQTADNSSLTMTAYERWVNPVVDAISGATITNPTDLQKSAATLNFLCATNNHKLPGSASFNWNWIEPQSIEDSSGVISINRNTIAQYIVDQIVPLARKSCIKPSASCSVNAIGAATYRWGFQRGQNPTTAITGNGPVVATIKYHDEARSHDSAGAGYAELNLTSDYSCSVMFGTFDFGTFPPKYKASNTFTVTQRLTINAYVQWAATGGGANVFDKTLVDTYTISTDANGNLTTTRTASTSTDNSESGKLNSFVNFFTGVNDLIQSIKNNVSDFANTSISSIPFDRLKNFVFPGAKVFTYKTATFSDFQDLVCLITYVKPTDGQFGTRAISAFDLEEPAQSEVIEVPEIPEIALYIKQLQEGSFLKPGLSANTTLKSFIDEGVVVDDHNGKDATRSLDGGANGYPNGDTRGTVHQATVTDPKLLTYVATSRQGINEFATEQSASLVAGTVSSLAAAPGSTKVSITSEMMQNYVQGELISAQNKFRAVQTADGHALLFAINTSGVFNVIEEKVGVTKTGWSVMDLSSATIKSGFPSGATVRTFGVGQSVMDNGTIGVAMAVTSNGSDNLFLSLLNSNVNTSWTSKPNWRSMPFDGQNRPKSIQITNIYFSETEQKNQYILVDILRDPTSALKDTVRYIVNPFSTAGPFWKPHTLPFDVEDGTYQSCMGRASGDFIDGIYTSGTVAGAGQLAYVPLFNLSGNAAPMPTRLSLPNRTIATAIASSRNGDSSSDAFGTTDLYAVGGSTLYRWAADDQVDDNTPGKPLIRDNAFAGTTALWAMTYNGVTTLFGRNASNVVYYTSCRTEQLANPGSWSMPVPVLAGIERITAYINRKDGGNTIFAAGGNKLQKIMQATNTPSKLWQVQDITLAAQPQKPSISFKSYTTIIQVTDSRDQPVNNAEVTITTPARTPVYINGLYYILSTVPVRLRTDTRGQIAVTQATDSVVGAILTVSVNDVTKTYSPMDKSWNKLAALSDKNGLKGAKIATGTKAGGIVGSPTTAPLIATSTSDADAQAVADLVGKLKEAYSSVPPPASARSLALLADSTPHAPVSMLESASFGVLDGISMAAGDLYRWLKSGVDKVVQIIKNTVTNVWEFIANIAGQVYRAVLNTAEAVVGALEWVFDKIKTGIQDIIRFIEFLFEWDDIRRTKDIMHRVIKFYLQDMVSGIKTAQSAFDKQIGAAQKTIAKWAGIKDWTPLGDSASKPSSNDAVNTGKNQTSGSQLLSNHFRDQADQLTLPNGPPQAGLVQKLIDDLINALQQEGAVLSQTFDKLKALANDFNSLSVGDVLKRLAGILTEAVLGSTQVVVDALLNVLFDLANAAITVLDTKIHIPIISDILNAIGIPDLSFLDLITWIAAVGVTVVYKIVNKVAPFPDNSTSRALLAAKDWNALVAALSSSSNNLALTSNGVFEPAKANGFVKPVEKAFSPSEFKAAKASAQASIEIPQLSGPAAGAIFVSGHAIAGFIQFTGNFLFFAEAMDNNSDNAFGIPSAVMGVIGAAGAGSADALVAKMPLEQPALKVISKITTVATIMSKLLFSGPAQKSLATGKLSFLKAADGRKTGSFVNCVLIFPALVCTSYHFAELSEKPASAARSAAIVGECSNLCSYFSRISYCVALNDPDPETRLIPAGIMSVCNLAVSGLETAVAVIN